MVVEFKKIFLKDLDNVNNQKLANAIDHIIDEVKLAGNIHQINNLKKLQGFKSAFRIKLKEYRIGLVIETNTVFFVRFLHRKDIYKYFP